MPTTGRSLAMSFATIAGLILPLEDRSSSQSRFSSGRSSWFSKLSDINSIAKAMAMAGPAPGKPLITFGDMLRDLSDRRPASQPEPDEPDSPNTIKQKKIAQLRSMFYSSGPKAATPSTGRNAISTEFEGLNLIDAFERVYADLTEALSGDGDQWVGLSEQLSTVLKTANQLIVTAQQETGPLVDRIRSLQALVERGRLALTNAQTSLNQT